MYERLIDYIKQTERDEWITKNILAKLGIFAIIIGAIFVLTAFLVNWKISGDLQWALFNQWIFLSITGLTLLGFQFMINFEVSQELLKWTEQLKDNLYNNTNINLNSQNIQTNNDITQSNTANNRIYLTKAVNNNTNNIHNNIVNDVINTNQSFDNIIEYVRNIKNKYNDKNNHWMILLFVYKYNRQFSVKEIAGIFYETLWNNVWSHFSDLKKDKIIYGIPWEWPLLNYTKWWRVGITEQWITLLQKNNLLQDEDSETSSEWQK